MQMPTFLAWKFEGIQEQDNPRKKHVYLYQIQCVELVLIFMYSTVLVYTYVCMCIYIIHLFVYFLFTYAYLMCIYVYVYEKRPKTTRLIRRVLKYAPGKARIAKQICMPVCRIYRLQY